MIRARGLLPGIPGSLLLLAAAVAWAQGAVIPDLRNPALFREPPRSASCRVCGEVSSIREVRGDASVPGSPGLDHGASKANDWAVVGAVVLVPIVVLAWIFRDHLRMPEHAVTRLAFAASTANARPIPSEAPVTTAHGPYRCCKRIEVFMNAPSPG